MKVAARAIGHGKAVERSSWRTIVAQKPRLLPYRETMRQNLAAALRICVGQVSVKATTTENLGFEGREEGISASCVVLLSR